MIRSRRSAKLGVEADGARRHWRGGQEVAALGVGREEAIVADEVGPGRRDEGPPAPPGQYVCVVSPDSDILPLAECSGGTNNNCPIRTQKPVTIDLNVKYRIVATAAGSTIGCALPDLGVSLSAVDTTYASGGVTLSTFYADASFDYLKVLPP